MNNIFGWMSKPIGDMKYIPNHGGSAVDTHHIDYIIAEIAGKDEYD